MGNSSQQFSHLGSEVADIRRRLRFLALVVLLMVVGVSGCARLDGRSKDMSSKGTTRQGHSHREDHGIVELEHDFGQVPPKSENKHCYKITNTSAVAWTLKKIHRACSCTVSAMSRQSIAPGATEEVTSTFSVGDKEGKFTQSVLLEFREPTAPLIRLRAMVSVHHPVSCSQDVLIVNPVRVGTREEQFVNVRNFSKEEWPSLVADRSADWISVEIHENPKARDASEDDRPLQLWNVALRIDGSRLSEGWNETRVTFHPTADRQEKAELVIRAYRIPAVLVEPSTIFCGIVARGGPSPERTLRFVFRGRSDVPAIDSIRTTVGRVPMTLRWQKDPRKTASLLLTVTVRTTGDTLTDYLTLDFGKGRLMRIPVRGSFRDTALERHAPLQKSKSGPGVK